MSWTKKYEIWDKVIYTEPSGFEWESEVLEICDTCVKISWRRDRETHPQWRKFNRAYITNYTTVYSESVIRKVN